MRCWNTSGFMGIAWRAEIQLTNGAAMQRNRMNICQITKPDCCHIRERGIKIPEAKPGIVYKDMGVQENQNCTAITLRMKHRRMRWSINGANNMAKALYRKENRELIDTIERYTDGLIFTMQMQEIVQTLSAAKAPKKDGKGNRDVDVITHHMPLLEAMRTASRKAFMSAFCS